MRARHVISLADIGADNIAQLVNRALHFAKNGGNGKPPLEGKMVGIYFRRSSTRTRMAFSVGALKLGAGVVACGPNDLQITTGETTLDTARVLSGFLNILVVRTNDSVEEMRQFASQDRMAVVNAMSDTEHPTQAIADLTTMCDVFGRLCDLHVLYIGEGNNTTSALAFAIAQTPGMRLTIVTPEGYSLSEKTLGMARQLAEMHGSVIEQHHSMNELPRDVDVVYTTRWQTMGEPKSDPHWLEKFKPYSVTPAVMARASKSSGTIFMHDLPAVRGQEVVDEVLDGEQSRAFLQARHKLSGAMAVLEWCVAGS